MCDIFWTTLNTILTTVFSIHIYSMLVFYLSSAVISYSSRLILMPLAGNWIICCWKATKAACALNFPKILNNFDNDNVTIHSNYQAQHFFLHLFSAGLSSWKRNVVSQTWLHYSPTSCVCQLLVLSVPDHMFVPFMFSYNFCVLKRKLNMNKSIAK